MKTVCVVSWWILGLVILSPAFGSDTHWTLSAEGTLASDFIDRVYSRSPSRPSAQISIWLGHRSGFLAGLSRRFGRLDAELALFLSDAPPVPTWGQSFEKRWGLTLSLPLFSLGRSGIAH